jgi:LDH2 family malate/lactate/ureidoglycolate dehydrogenase
VPTHGREARFGTNPIAFAAPAGRNPPFLLDMATSTVALGKFKLYARDGKAIPPGWALDAAGAPQTDPKQALVDRLMTPLGGGREGGGHKGYGLAAMVEILSTVLAGASYAPLRAAGAERNDVGHFHLALHPEAFRDAGAFESDLDALVEALRATPPADPAQPVMVAGDPEYAARERRRREGIPVPHSLLAQVQAIAERIGAAFSLAETVGAVPPA